MPTARSAWTAGLLSRYLSRLKFPWLFGLFVTLFGLDLLLPDLIPFVDELLLGMMTLLLGSWKQRKEITPIETQARRKP